MKIDQNEETHKQYKENREILLKLTKITKKQ